ncbi:MAG: imidazole glycerol phosphate synthase subunit HisH [Candidatus Yanofskybacteria bacterium]|nr:imidazole glycerol phosphate synthase subunit HisH [Candidatus Yanofskybacteria bacterium]
MNNIVIVDYGVGNILSVTRAFTYVGGAPLMTDSPDLIRSAKALVLPGVGAFGSAIQMLREKNLLEPILEVAKSGRPFLGICLGMQMMMEESEEFGSHKGLGLIAGNVVAIPYQDTEGNSQKVPHVGWNTISDRTNKEGFEDEILRGIKQGSSFYFVHSFLCSPMDEEERVADTSYGGVRIAAVIRKGNLFGCQFHPEKSGGKGLVFLKNFLDIVHKQSSILV